MSPQETQTLQDFLNQLTQVRGISKAPQAAAMIAAAVAQQPDAAYLLVQRALLVEQALGAAKAQVATLQSQLQAAQSGTAATPGFLDSNAWGNAAGAPLRAAAAPAPAYVPSAQTAPPAVNAPMAPPAAAAPAPGFFGGGLGSTLGTVAATAAGVAGGAFLFQGIEHLINGNGSGGLGHQNAASAPVENTTVNNYYGSDAERDRTRDSDSGSDRQDASSGNDFDDLSNIDLADGGDSGGVDDSIV
ncbi:DUF2076 family protein [Herbaspirillum sp. YR522]|uniref:DUF2076 family protein n=1 Tax=Herbaspirillum sp. YR522 TaxID=1144342 RepID=UPI00026F6537|nr:DUF2076 family protein [Herbaspirillum sp. YR522]EJN03581.1 hypothetical protein PMI40_02684 [Herbaspirillum sp. YR522]